MNVNFWIVYFIEPIKDYKIKFKNVIVKMHYKWYDNQLKSDHLWIQFTWKVRNKWIKIFSLQNTIFRTTVLRCGVKATISSRTQYINHWELKGNRWRILGNCLWLTQNLITFQTLQISTHSSEEQLACSTCWLD